MIVFITYDDAYAVVDSRNVQINRAINYLVTIDYMRFYLLWFS